MGEGEKEYKEGEEEKEQEVQVDQDLRALEVCERRGRVLRSNVSSLWLREPPWSIRMLLSRPPAGVHAQCNFSFSWI